MINIEIISKLNCPYYEDENILFFNTDCIKLMELLSDKFFDLILIDPPYNIKKAEWDNFKSDEKYYNFILNFMKECQRVSKDNSSTYFFHNDFEKIVELQYRIKRETNYIFRQFIIWNKMFNESKNKGYLQGYIDIESDRNYRKMVEYILFYTFQDETGLKKNYNNLTLFKPIRDYFYNERKKTKLSLKQINKDVLNTTYTGGGMASNILVPYKLGWTFPTKEMYEKLQKINICLKPYVEIEKEYNTLKNQYDILRIENENNRYYYNNQKTHHSVWNYDFESSWHPTPKPIPLINNILNHSARPNSIIFNPFNGSENILIACMQKGFKVIGTELDIDYFNDAVKRIKLERAKIKDEFYLPEKEKNLFNI